MRNAHVAAAALLLSTVAFMSSAEAAKRYPPHGYPCLGCYPCPPSYCDNDNKRVIKFDRNGEPVDPKYRGPVSSPSRAKGGTQ
jgi:hypothetical protein